MATFKGFVKGKKKEDGEGHFWNETGHTLFVTEYEGKPSYSMLDARMPEDKSVKFFPLYKKGEGKPAGNSRKVDEPF